MNKKSIENLELHNHSPIVLDILESLLVLENTHYSLSIIINNLIASKKIEEPFHIQAIQGDIQMLEQEISRLKEKLI